MTTDLDAIFNGFGPWLEQQGEREFNLAHCHDCAFATYIKEACGHRDPVLMPTMFKFNRYDSDDGWRMLRDDIAKAITNSYPPNGSVFDPRSTKPASVVLTNLRTEQAKEFALA